MVQQTLQRRAVQCSFIGVIMSSQVQWTVLRTQFWVYSEHISHLRFRADTAVETAVAVQLACQGGAVQSQR